MPKQPEQKLTGTVVKVLGTHKTHLLHVKTKDGKSTITVQRPCNVEMAEPGDEFDYFPSWVKATTAVELPKPPPTPEETAKAV